jgi:anti-sigma B factor antagonist
MSMPEAREPRLQRVPGPGEGVVVLDLAGELDLAVSARFRELVDGVAADAPSLVVADLQEVGFMDSTMLRELLRAHREVGGAGGRFVLAAAQPSVQRLLELTGTADVFDVAASRDAALASSHS